MPVNLANIFAKLKRFYGDGFTITYALPPSYMINIVGAKKCKDKIVLVYREDRSAFGRNFVSPVKLNIKSEKADSSGNLDLTGSPLKDDCLVEAIGNLSLDLKTIESHAWTNEETIHRGISIDKARFIIGTEDFQISKDVQGSVWFLCTGADAKKAILLQYEFATNSFKRGIVTFIGVIKTIDLNIDYLRQIHFRNMFSVQSFRTYIENVYHLKSTISIRCCWSSTASEPWLIDLNTCEVTLMQSVQLNSSGPLTQDFLNQLQILMFIRDDIIAYKEAEKADIPKEPVYRCGRGIDMDELRESINKVMTEISGFSDIDANSGIEYDIEAVVQRAKIRRLTDLTDKLWEIMKCCSSYKDLKTGFLILFQCAARCNIVNTPTNKNRLADIITQIANRRLAIPCLSGSEPLELLLEIGLEKLYKDFEYIFTESKICSTNLLKNKSKSEEENKGNDAAMPNIRKSLHNAVRPEPQSARKTLLHNNIKNKKEEDADVGFKNSNFDETDSVKTLSKLLQIHCTLEHLLLLHIELNLGSVLSYVCDQLLQKPLRIVDTIDDLLVDKMEISVAPHEIRDHLEGKEPYSRYIVMKSKNALRSVKSTFFFCMENICPPGISENFNVEDKECVKENTYYAWLYTKIKTPK